MWLKREFDWVRSGSRPSALTALLSARIVGEVAERADESRGDCAGGWVRVQDVVAFQCRNPVHRAHYELFTRALDADNVKPGSVVLVHPTCGPTQVDGRCTAALWNPLHLWWRVNWELRVNRAVDINVLATEQTRSADF
jgi:hypothetical protein